MTATSTTALTPSLEDYLETIYELVRHHKVARVRDIARARHVKASSVTPAMRRLDEMGLIAYGRREYIELTAEGERAARRVLSRHQLLARFLEEVLVMSPVAAQRDACVMEHHLSDEAMDRLVRFFEFLRTCSRQSKDLLEEFHRCVSTNTTGTGLQEQHAQRGKSRAGGENEPRTDRVSGAQARALSDLLPGQCGTVLQVNAGGKTRRRLLDMGLLPDKAVTVERSTGDRVYVRLGGFLISIPRSEANFVTVNTTNL